MGCKILERKRISFSIIFLLIFSQIIFLADSLQYKEDQHTNQDMRENPENNEKPLEVNTAAYSCYDFLVANKKIYALLNRWLDILDISDPLEPIDATVNETLTQYLPRTITNEKNTILFALGNQPNTSLYTIQLDEDENKVTKVAFWNNYIIQKMILKDDTLYSLAWLNEIKSFTIHNVTDIENVQLLGNTSTNYYSGYYRNMHIPDFYFIHENNCYFITEEGNLAIYQINSTYQLSFIKEYDFTNLRNLYFTEEYLFTCDTKGLQIYDYSSPENLKLEKQYNITDARSVQVRNETAYLITGNHFLTIDLSNFEENNILDQYDLGKNEPINLMKIELEKNLAIVITERYDTAAAGYMGYLYIFDIMNPSKIFRLYPEKIPTNPYSTGAVLLTILVVYGIPILGIALLITIPIVIVRRKQRKEVIVYKRE